MLTFSPVKRDRRTPSHRRVHFQRETISEVHLIEISPGKIVRNGDTSSSIRPHIPGNTFYRSHPNVSIGGRASFIYLIRRILRRRCLNAPR
jgi:hypothetical protein